MTEIVNYFVLCKVIWMKSNRKKRGKKSMTKFMVRWSIQAPKGNIGTEIERLEDTKTGITAIRLLFSNQEKFWFLSNQLEEITEWEKTK